MYVLAKWLMSLSISSTASRIQSNDSEEVPSQNPWTYSGPVTLMLVTTAPMITNMIQATKSVTP